MTRTGPPGALSSGDQAIAVRPARATSARRSGRRSGPRTAAAPAAGPARRCRTGLRAIASLWSSSSGSGSASQAAQRLRVGGVEPAEAERRQLRGPPGSSPTAIGSRCSADSISGSPKPSHDDGSTTASQAAYAPGMCTSNGSRRRTGTRPAASTASSSCLVAVLGRTGQPVRAAERPASARARRRCPCAGWPGSAAAPAARRRPASGAAPRSAAPGRGCSSKPW